MNNFTLKLLAVLFMVIDHIGYFFIQNEYNSYFRYAGRLAMPIFFFLFVEGFMKTSNRKKHFCRLALYSILMFAGNAVLYFTMRYRYPFHTNILFSMLICYVILWIIETDIQKWMKIFAMLVLFGFSNFVEYGILTVLLTLLFYVYFKYEHFNKINLAGLYIAGSLLYCNLFSPQIQWFMVFALPFMLLYNGKQGYKSKITQHGFYLFYILHLWLFLIIRNLGFVIK